MSRHQVQRLVVDELRKSNVPLTVSALISQIRREHQTVQQVTDFDIRSAIVALTAFGTLDMTASSEVAVSKTEPAPAHG